MKTDNIMKHILSTYFNLRIGMGLLSLAFPMILWIGEQRLRESLSAYYYGDARDLFVGILIAIGAALYLYKGFSDAENIALNFAGFFAVCVAIFPVGGRAVLGFEFRGAGTTHIICAVLFFLSIAYVAWFRASDTLALLDNATLRGWYQKAYKAIAIAMILFPLLAVVLAFALQAPRFWVFAVEAVAIWIFAFYWLLKTFEISVLTHADEVMMVEPSRLYEVGE